ncbi:MAG: sulfatase-like hydrolase/transferase [Planctomycetota bacterium]
MSDARPNTLFIMSDDHASHAMSCYGSRINRTPNLDRIADGGMRLDNCFCTNSICTPSRATILSGTYNHVNGVTTLASNMDNSLPTFPKMLQADGYQTAMFGKWHLGQGRDHCPTGFDDWAVLPGQGNYFNPEFLFAGPDGGTRRTVQGYVTDIITDLCLDWLDERDPDRPFCMLYHHKAPHRPWYPDEKHADMFLNEDVPEPDTLYDDYSNRAAAAAAAEMRVGVHITERDVKGEVPAGMPEEDARRWGYQRYIKDYLRGETPEDWREAMYYRYWMHKRTHNVYAHYGIRTDRYKLIYYYSDPLDQPGAVDESHEPEWELFDLEKDPHELNSVYDDPEYADVVAELKGELHRLQAEVGDERYPKDVD